MNKVRSTQPSAADAERTITLRVSTLVDILVVAVIIGVVLGALWVGLNDSAILQGASHARY